MHIHICTYLHMHKCIRKHTGVYMCTYIYTIYIYIHVYIHIYTHSIYIICVCVYIYIYMYIYTYIYIYMCILCIGHTHTCVRICMYTCYSFKSNPLWWMLPLRCSCLPPLWLSPWSLILCCIIVFAITMISYSFVSLLCRDSPVCGQEHVWILFDRFLTLVGVISWFSGRWTYWVI